MHKRRPRPAGKVRKMEIEREHLWNQLTALRNELEFCRKERRRIQELFGNKLEKLRLENEILQKQLQFCRAEKQSILENLKTAVAEKGKTDRIEFLRRQIIRLENSVAELGEDFEDHMSQFHSQSEKDVK